MNRRQVLAASTLALAGCGGDEKKAQSAPPAGETAKTERSNAFKATVRKPPVNRPLTPCEVHYEAQVAAILLTALRPRVLASIPNSAAPSMALGGVMGGQGASQDAYKRVKDYMAANPNIVEPLLRDFQGLVRDMTLTFANSPDDPYTGDPEGCLTDSNLSIVHGLFRVPKPGTQCPHA
jgi:hypothetical protein